MTVEDTCEGKDSLMQHNLLSDDLSQIYKESTHATEMT